MEREARIHNRLKLSIVREIPIGYYEDEHLVTVKRATRARSKVTRMKDTKVSELIYQ